MAQVPRVGSIDPVRTFIRPEPAVRTLVAGQPVIRVAAWWLKMNPWVWKCPDCEDGFIAAEDKHLAVSAAFQHRDLAHL